MRQAREHVGLAREILDCFFLLDAVADDHLLDRDRTVGEAGVVGEVDAAHAADAKDLLDAVAAVEKMALGELSTRIHGVSLKTLLQLPRSRVSAGATGGNGGSRDRF